MFTSLFISIDNDHNDDGVIFLRLSGYRRVVNKVIKTAVINANRRVLHGNDTTN